MSGQVILSYLAALEPIGWFLLSIPVFTYSIQLPPDSRWGLLPLNLILPIQCYLTVDRLADRFPGLDWLWAFTSLIYILHSTSALYLQRWELPPNPAPSGRSEWNLLASYKAWNNARRLPIQLNQPNQPTATASQRVRFLIRNILLVALLAFIYVVFELLTLLILNPQPSDFSSDHRHYFHFHLDRASAVRAVFALHWAWLTYLILTVANTFVGILFVVILQVDTPEEWPPLFGSPLQAYTLRRFWGIFWHRLGSPAQAEYGYLVARRGLGLGAGGAAEKTFLALWVFVLSGAIHGLVTWKTDPHGTPLADINFLLLNFAGGLLEVVFGRLVKWPRTGAVSTRSKGLTRKMMGFLWVFAFFYCTVPQYQYPTLQRTAEMRAPLYIRTT